MMRSTGFVLPSPPPADDAHRGTPGTSDVAPFRSLQRSSRPSAEAAVDEAPPSRYAAVKNGAERVLAVLMLIPAVPLVALTIALVKLTSRGPAIYAQRRVGHGGRIFVPYKIRTMWHDRERESGPRWAAVGDSRVTPVGRFLRRTHLNELPQLLNVIRGEMGLIGPRPERPEFVSQLERAIPHYRDRLAVLPGLTGLAQVQLPPDSDLPGVRRKLACDLHYARWGRPWLDARILVATGLKVVGVPLSTCCRLCRLPSGEVVEVTYSCREGWSAAMPCSQTA
jgi:lipopolysaccharide/colanic/teichoic acid biosynthesis glycosyltransferase